MKRPEQGCSVEPTSIKGLLDDNGHLSLEHRAQELDYNNQTATEDHQGGSKQDDAHSKIWEIEIHKDVLAWRNTKSLVRRAGATLSGKTGNCSFFFKEQS